MQTYWRLLTFARPFKKYVPKYFLFVLGAVLFSLINFTLLIPVLDILFRSEVLSNQEAVALNWKWSPSGIKTFFTGYFTNLVISNGANTALVHVSVIIIISSLLANSFRYLAARVLNNLRTMIVKNLRQGVFEKLIGLDVVYFNQQRKGDLLAIVSSDILEIENSIINSVQILFKDPIMLLGYLALLFAMSPELTLFTFILFPISGILIGSISRRLKKDANQSQSLQGSILSMIEETIGGIRVIKAFAAEKIIRDRFDEQNWNYRNLLKKMYNRRDVASPISEFLGVTTVVGVIFYGGSLVLKQESTLSASEFIAYIILYTQLLIPAKGIASMATNLQRGIAAGERVFKVIDTPQALDYSNAKTPIENLKDNIRFNNVSFAYEEKIVLHNIQLQLQKGKVYALVGASGAGKSTLMDLILRFIDPTSGQIEIDELNIKSISPHSLRKIMGFVSQDTILFNDTIFNNIAFGIPNASQADVENAAKIAHAHEFIIQLENGYQTPIGDRGLKLSGGQRQRLTIARAILKNPPILLLDEATSALDTASERLVQEALQALLKNRTALVIAHRLSTIQYADEIIVLHKGAIVEKGTHQNLYELGGYYKRLVDLQQL